MLAPGAQAVALERGGRPILRYDGLVAFDARGRELHSWLKLDGTRLEIRVDDRGAAFPVRIDPFLQQAELTASDGANHDQFGVSVAVSADASTVVVGAPLATVGGNAYQGAVYVFTRPPSGWATETQTAKLTASDGATGDELGFSVGVSGDGSTVLAGAPIAKVGNNTNEGSVYVFARPPSGWATETQTAKLIASDGTAGDEFGSSVALSADGSTAAASAPFASIGGKSYQGAVYLFARPSSGWGSPSEEAKLTASDGAANDELGSSLAVSSDGSTVVAGTPFVQVGSNAKQGAAYVFVRPSLGWTSGTQQAKLTASDGAAGDYLAHSLAVSSDGSTVAAGANLAQVAGNVRQGAAYVFVRSTSGWMTETQTAKLTASDGAAYDQLGKSVAVSSDGSTVVSGAAFAQIGSNAEQGAAYQFARPSSGWTSETQTAKMASSNGGVQDELGVSLAISSDGSTVVAGMPFAKVGTVAQGGAYVFGASTLANPSVSLTAPSTGTVGSAIAGSSIAGALSGGSSPSGPVTFTVFGPQPTAPTNCSGGTTLGTASASGDGTYHPSAGFTPSGSGNYWWYASYSGDSNNNPASSPCGTPMAETIVASPSGGGGGGSGGAGGGSGGGGGGGGGAGGGSGGAGGGSGGAGGGSGGAGGVGGIGGGEFAPIATTASLSSSANPSTPGEQVTFSAIVTPTPDGGTVSFTKAATTIPGCGAVPINTSTGIATCRVTYIATGSYSIGAKYSGDLAFAGSWSQGLSQIVIPTITLRGSPSGQSGLVSFTLSCALQSGGCPVTASPIAIETLHGHAIVAVGAHARGPHRAVLVGKTTLVVPPGKTIKVAVKLNTTGRKLLSRFKRLPVQLMITLTVGGRRTTVTVAKVTVSSSKRQPHRRR